MNIFACMLKIVLVIFSKFLGYPINSTYSSKSLFFLRVLYSDYHGKMSFLSFSWIIKKKKWEELPHAQGQGWRPRVPGSNGTGAGERSYPTFKVRRGDLVQGKEQQLHFAGVAVKRYPTSKVRETQVRW